MQEIEDAISTSHWQWLRTAFRFDGPIMGEINRGTWEL